MQIHCFYVNLLRKSDFTKYMAKTTGITRQKLEENIRKKDFAPIYLLMGEESFYIDYLADLLLRYTLTEEEQDFNLTTFYGADASMNDVILACRRYPMMAERQVVILKEAQATKTGRPLNWDLLQQYACNPSPTTVLIVCHKGGTVKATKLIKSLNQPMSNGQPTGIVFESPLLREFNIDKAVSEYINSTGCRIEDKAQAMLNDHIGYDMALLAKEIDKLRMTLPQNGTITTALVEQNVGISKEYNNFELINAIAKRDRLRAFKIVQYFRANPKKGPTVLTASALFNFFSNMLIGFYARSSDERILMEAMRLKTSYQLKDYRYGMHNFNATQSLKAIIAIREFDARSKGIGSNRNEYDLLEELIAKIFNV